MITHPISSVTAFVSEHPRRCLWFIYLPVYLLLFVMAENHVVSNAHRIHSPLDNYIPFAEVFVLPYFIWFGYMFFGFFYLYKRRDPKPFYRLCGSCFTAMTIFLIVSVVYPNYHDLRPVVMPRDNIFCDMLGFLYMIDTPTNLLPSIHVCATISVHTALATSDDFNRLPHARHITFVLSVLIVLATMLIKQHSTVDVTLAFLLMACEYPVFFGRLSNRFMSLINRLDPDVGSSESLELAEPERSYSIRRHS